MNSRVAWVVAILLALTGVVAALPITASQQVPRGISYVGHLDENGAPVSAAVQVRFKLYDGDTPAAALLWTGAVQDVNVVSGHFSAVLGEGTDPALPDAAFASNNLHLAININGTDLGGRQRIRAVPFSVRTTSAYEASATSPLDVRLASAESRLGAVEARFNHLDRLRVYSGAGFQAPVDVADDAGWYTSGAGDYRVQGFTSCPDGRIFRVGYTGTGGILTLQNNFATCNAPGCYRIYTRTGADVALLGSSRGVRSFLCAGGQWNEI
jgi:hypothetical protein